MQAAMIVDGEIKVQERPDPAPGTGEVLVRVHSAGCNGADLLQRAGHYPPPPGAPADIPGLELAGVVIATGDGVQRFKGGERVMAVVGGGAQAELAVVNEQLLMKVPESVSLTVAGGIPEVFATAYDALFTQAQLSSGERLLVHGAAGGVGTAAVQLGCATGASVTATVRNPEVRDQVAALGATVLDPTEFAEHGPYDVILELVGAPNMAQNLKVLAVGGRITVIGIGGGAKAEVNLGLMLAKRARIHGSTLRARSLEDRAQVARRVERHVLPLFESGALTVPIAARYPLAAAAEAYARFEAGAKFGKIMIEPGLHAPPRQA